METKTITIISEFGDDLQAWTFDIKETDLVQLMLKYDGQGASLLSDAEGIAEEIIETYK